MTTATADPATATEYPCIDTGDGWYIVRDVPLTATIPADARPDIPGGVDAVCLRNAVNFSINEWDRGGYCGPAHLSHNKLLSLSDPRFLGHVVPRRLGTYTFANGEQLPTIFGDVKLNKKGYEMGRAGELPYISVEWDVNERVIDSLAFLQSRPPHFRFRLFKPAEAVKDESARLHARTRLAYLAKMTEPPKDDPKDTKAEHVPCEHCTEKTTTESKDKGGTMPEPAKIEATPHEQPKPEAEEAAKKAKLEADKAATLEAAKYEGRIAALEQRDKARDEADKVAALVVKANERCRGYVMTDKLRESIAKFAKLGDEHMTAFLDAYLAGATKAPASSLSEFEQTQAIPDNDPVIAKLAKTAEETSAAKRLMAQYKTIKQKCGASFTVSAEDHIRYNLASAVKAAQEGRA